MILPPPCQGGGKGEGPIRSPSVPPCGKLEGAVGAVHFPGGKQGRNRGAPLPTRRRPSHPAGSGPPGLPVASAGVGPAPGALRPHAAAAWSRRQEFRAPVGKEWPLLAQCAACSSLAAAVAPAPVGPNRMQRITKDLLSDLFHQNYNINEYLIPSVKRLQIND